MSWLMFTIWRNHDAANENPAARFLQLEIKRTDWLALVPMDENITTESFPPKDKFVQF